MRSLSHKLLLMQGDSEEVICGCGGIGFVVRWTPLACALLGLLGVGLRSPHYMLALGALTIIGAVSSRSFYDCLCLLVKPVWDLGDMPRHGNQRRFGCGIGAGLPLWSGLGLLVGSPLLSFIPSAVIIGLAFVAAAT